MQKKAWTELLMKQTIKNKKRKNKCQKLQIKVFKKLTYARMIKRLFKHKLRKNENLTRQISRQS